MADYIPTSAEFDRDNNVTDWSRTTVADGNWLQKNTIGPLKQRDIELLELIRQHKGNVYSAGDYINIDENNVISVSGLSGTESWMRFSIDNGSEDFAEEAENDYYIGKENSAFGRAKIIGDDNMALNSTIIGDNNVGISTSELIKKDGTSAHYETVGIYPAQNFIVGDGNIATKTRNAFIFGNDNYTETTEADLQLDCDPDDPNSKGQNNDGFTLAFGLCNSAIRNYDMAIGKDVLASGGENIVIGAPIETHAKGDRVPYKTESIGYRNLNIRSKINGAGNKAFESVAISNTNNCTSETQDNILDYSDIFISGNPNNKVQFRRNTLSHAEDVSIETTANDELIVHNNEFNDVRELHFSTFTAGYLDATPAVESNTIIKAEQLDITANRFANNNLYDVHYGNDATSNISVHHFINNNLSRITKMNISGTHFNNNTFDNIAVPHESILNIDYAYFNIFKNIKNTSSPVKIEANRFNYNLLLNTDIPDLSGDPEGYTCYAHNIFFNIAQSEPSSLTWTIKKTMENNIFLNSNNGYDHNHIILENPEYVSNNIIFHSTLSAVSAEGRDDTILNNVIINATANANFSGNAYSTKEYFVNNFLFNAILDSEPTHEGLIVTAHGHAHQVVNNVTLGQNFIFGATAKNVAGSFIVSDGRTNNNNTIPAIRYDNRIVAFGDEFILYSNDSTYLGNENSAHFNNNCFIAGECNKMCISGLAADWYVGKTLTNENSFSRCFILGVENELLLDQPLCPENYETVAPTAPARNFLIGSKNKIHVSGRNVTQNILIGDSNILGYNKNASDLGSWSFGYTCYADRNLLFGTNNKLSDEENDNIILGNNNIVATEIHGDNPIYSTNVVLGGFNSAFNGSNQINIGYRNETREHFAGTIGRYLESHGNQLIVGQCNDYTTTNPPILLASAWNNNTAVTQTVSGVLFAVGNGLVNAFEYTDENGTGYYTAIDQETGKPTGKITEEHFRDCSTKSNAMIVSADGTVSARTYKAHPDTKLGKLFDFLATATGGGDLHWDASTSTWSFNN